MRRRMFVMGAAAAAVVPVQAQAFFCANCTQEGGEIAREIKRAIEFARLLSTAKESAMNEYRTWRSVYEVRNFRGLTTALGRVTNTYYPDANAIPGMMRTGQSLLGDGTLDLDRLLSRGTTSRIATGFGSVERWFDAMEGRQRIVAFGRQAAGVAMGNAQGSIRALGAAESILAGTQGSAELAAGQAALQLHGNNTQANMVQLTAIRTMIEVETQHAELRADERDRQDAMAYAQETEWALRQLGRAR